MTTSNIVYGAVVVGAVLGVLAFFNFTPFRTIVQDVTNTTFGASPAGTTFNTAKTASCEAGSNTQSTTTYCSLLNGDANARIIKSAFCTIQDFNSASNPNNAAVNVGTTGLLIQAATSTVASNIFAGTATNTNFIYNYVAATSSNTNYFYNSSSSPGIIGSPFLPQATSTRFWASGTYVNFVANATTSNTATVCGVDYSGS